MTGVREQGNGLPPQEAAPRPRSRTTLRILAACALIAFAGLLALGTWQLYRLQWKQALIERVEQRVHAAPVPAPGPSAWHEVRADTHEYRRVRLSGTYLHSLSTRVQAVTGIGSGYWLLTPLRTQDGSIVLVNRGFIPPRTGDFAAEKSSDGPAPVVTVTGLLRMSEPGGGFLRRNDPAADRWYSRDVAAIARARGLDRVAPYFVDADKASATASSDAAAAVQPVGGLTVISFHNNHLVYALTWYALALMVAAAAAWVARDERRMRRAADTRRDGD